MMVDPTPAGFPSVSVIVPVYNSAPVLREVAERTLAMLASNYERYELILVDDGSRDGSWGVLCELSDRHTHVRALALSRNFGQHNALLAGIERADHDVIVTMDDDLQHLPEQVPLLVAALGDNLDLVYGVPRAEEHGTARSLASRTTKWLMRRILGWEDAPAISAFRAFRTRLRAGFSHHDPFVSIDVLLSWTTTRVADVSVEMQPRPVGRSNYTFRRLVRHTIDTVTAYSVIPLRAVSYLGLAMALFGIGVLAWVLGRYFLQGGSVPGFPFLAAAIALFGGAQLLALGVIGEYLGRIHFRTMGRPPFVIRDDRPLPG